ncbi:MULTISPECIES: ring-opening amidohydrolase [unclassified Leptolyngbya]|uniref:cyanuric acid amidohydrolase n=1 Tax=unclassified Leptolyngbya TaxID=2650499 RepID=UPI00168984BA|nr:MULTISPECIES: ring-opening amidohydrolase [unclassified Leptolyngbya]MBD1913371.1 ring-opening amidohydrolase [Leptolyngbya sp. FACHB-8]MBD2158698.1 ring-opening amidohydrolase [Leptolyngbya sp. FACHB-16]
MKVDVFKVPQNAPDDLTELIALIQNQTLDPQNIVAIMGKTEGNGCVNDFTRGFAVATLKSYLRSHITNEQLNRIVFVMSGGTEGVLSPHLTIFTRQQEGLTGEPHPGLALGIHHTRDFLVDEIGTLAMVREVADGVRGAIADAGLSPADVHFVQIKCPLITASRQTEGQSPITQDSYKSMAYSRGASALGVALALGEINADQLTEADICHNYQLYSSVASTSAGVELRNCEILVLGNSPASHSDYVIGHSVMTHALDTAAVKQAIPQHLSDEQGSDVASVFTVLAKAEAAPSGEILGCRHTMLDDSDISHTRMARAVVGAVVASVVQDPMIYISGGSEHQGPPGGGPIAVICKRN